MLEPHGLRWNISDFAEYHMLNKRSHPEEEVRILDSGRAKNLLDALRLHGITCRVIG